MNNFNEDEEFHHLLQQLWLDSGEPDAPVDAAGEIRIRQVMNRIAALKKSKFSHLKSGRWWSVAAVVLLVLFAAWWFTPGRQKPLQTVLAKHHPVQIRPGGDKAYLTTASGDTIVLDHVHNGHITLQSGIQVSKLNSGMLLYQAGNATADLNATKQFNTITTPRGGQYQVVLSDGTRAWINSASTIKFPVAFSPDQRKVEITGEVYFEVAKNKKRPFLVEANHVQVQVLGTHFNVSAYPDDQSVVTTLMEGSVRLNKGGTSVRLKPGEQGIIYNNQRNMTVQPADIEVVEAWRKGQFIFHNQSIANVMKIMARWYDVDVSYEGNVRDKEFGGSASKDAGMVTLLENMKLTGAIHYKIEGRRVIVMN